MVFFSFTLQSPPTDPTTCTSFLYKSNDIEVVKVDPEKNLEQET